MPGIGLQKVVQTFQKSLRGAVWNFAELGVFRVFFWCCFESTISVVQAHASRNEKEGVSTLPLCLSFLRFWFWGTFASSTVLAFS